MERGFRCISFFPFGSFFKSFLLPLSASAFWRRENPALQHPVRALRADWLPPQVSILQACGCHAMRGPKHRRTWLEGLLQAPFGDIAWLQSVTRPQGLQQRYPWWPGVGWRLLYFHLALSSPWVLQTAEGTCGSKVATPYLTQPLIRVVSWHEVLEPALWPLFLYLC